MVGQSHTTHASNMTTEARTPLALFFSQYPSFHYNPKASATSEFHRLCDTFNWHRESKPRGRAHRRFQTSLVEQFNRIYGIDGNDLISWQTLCAHLRINPIPDSITQCKKVVKRTHVNIVDLIDSAMTGKRVKKFSSVHQLSMYTIDEDKFFPKRHAKAGNLLKHLLREIQ